MRSVWTAVIMLGALVVGCLVGLLTWLGGANPPNAILTAGASFCGLTSFGFTVFEFLTRDRARGEST
ncbi:hypothetical protein GCM10029963_75010 [Micromonospora andamanensis]|uniref:hypothetical protein n=1 Tax=Micromonospora andamanensis TaxID=1287068 RepID=UPI001952A011|nr:hypothetical protein [Micromonospora andamanensis]GIJ42676.1 hypothetical protein Vwe01_60010 [Micromonospora andamanensis]